jgi:DNA invertase Pin-like site-specific DNA recombinase
MGREPMRSNREQEPRSRPLRCAIYARKSTDEGLTQEFNTLEAQREAAEAYVQSQVHAGWTVLAERYDDGGYTGANLDRPALRKLLVDIEAGRVDAVLVYKVDRLSRSLLDFARLMEVFERHQVSLVSVTQPLNTTGSLGRLTLNILLSFAEFERQMIADRTRDKMAAARRKGKWVGGTPVLGYDIADGGGKLVVNPEEASQVQSIFALYLQHRSVAGVLAEIRARNWTTKRWRTREGKQRLGRPFTKATLHRLLGIAGYSIACLARQGAEIASLAVRPRYRQEGVATVLLKTTIRRVRRSGAQAVWLMVRRQNDEAIRLYLKLGFVHTGTVPNYYDDDASGWRTGIALGDKRHPSSPRRMSSA